MLAPQSVGLARPLEDALRLASVVEGVCAVAQCPAEVESMPQSACNSVRLVDHFHRLIRVAQYPVPIRRIDTDSGAEVMAHQLHPAWGTLGVVQCEN